MLTTHPGNTQCKWMSENAGSLAGAVDKINQSLFYGKTLNDSSRELLARHIVSTLGKPGSYASMFAPSSTDLEQGIRTFTGELLRSRAGISHVLGEEACRCLVLLKVPDVRTRDALALATQGMLQRLNQAEAEGYSLGMYCCGTCSVAYWRHLAAGGLDRNEERLVAAVEALKAHRTGDGHWRRFPFHYTLLALSEIGVDLALEEMRYAAKVLDRLTRRPFPKDQYSDRRHLLYERVLAIC